MAKRPKIRLYSFQERFVPAIERGDKTHTIRDIRKYPAEPGDILGLYYALRNKKCRRLMYAPCVKVENIEIRQINPQMWTVRVEEQTLSPDECTQLARRDGFGDFTEMMAFWDGRLPFKGHIIHWRPVLGACEICGANGGFCAHTNRPKTKILGR